MQGSAQPQMSDDSERIARIFAVVLRGCLRKRDDLERVRVRPQGNLVFVNGSRTDCIVSVHRSAYFNVSGFPAWDDNSKALSHDGKRIGDSERFGFERIVEFCEVGDVVCRFFVHKRQ